MKLPFSIAVINYNDTSLAHKFELTIRAGSIVPIADRLEKIKFSALTPSIINSIYWRYNNFRDYVPA